MALRVMPMSATSTEFEPEQKLSNGNVAKASSARQAAFTPSTSPLCVLFVTGLLLYAIKSTFPGYWQHCYNFIETQWNLLVDKCGVDDFNFTIWGTMLYSIVFYWVSGLLYLAMDLTERPKALRKYKVQPGTNEPLDLNKLPKMMGQVLFNETVVTIPIAWIGGMLQQSRHPTVRELPSLGKAIIDMAVFMIVFETIFYYSHRLLHHPRFYKRIHKMHHEWTSPIALTTIYCHPIEYVMSNILPQIMGPILMRTHLFTMWLWITYILFQTQINHCGYHLPFLPSPEHHDYHHLMFNSNFGGSEGFFDWLHGTDAKFRASVDFERSHVIMGLASARELHPDVPKKQD